MLRTLTIDSLFPTASKRADFDQWKFLIEEMKSFDASWFTNRISTEILQNSGVYLSPLNDSLEKEGGLYFFILEKFGFDITSSQVNKNEAYKMSTAISHMQKLSLLESKPQRDMISEGIFKINDFESQTLRL